MASEAILIISHSSILYLRLLEILSSSVAQLIFDLKTSIVLLFELVEFAVEGWYLF